VNGHAEKLKAIIFDFDGLILDTETSSYETARMVWAAHGAELTLATWQRHIGTHRRHWLDELEDIVGPIADRDAVLEQRRLAHHERLLAEVALPGVHDFVLSAHRAGVRLAVASSSTFDWVTTHLERLALLDYFDVIVNCEGGIPAKPAPDVYEAAVVALEADPSQAIAFEDSPNGVAAAKAAGLMCVAVPNRMTAALDLRAADLVVDSFVGIDLDALASLL
jgi:HAD superfamily hydrolase (TIGR01509 family)